MRKFLLFTLLALLGVATSYAQVTTSSLTGTVKDSKGETLIGASIKATHQPTGTTYGVSTRADGRFTIPNMRSGGPYLIEASYVGYQTRKIENIQLKLGEPYVQNVTLDVTGTELNEVTVSVSNPNSILNSNRNGAATSINRTQIQALPTITRSVNDITRLTPQGGGPNGSLAGGSYRGNNFTVDGANFNNQFGIGQNVPANGSPISLDALDQISINVTPYDVRQSGFTGGAINAVTRSGSNTFTGTAFMMARTDRAQGDKVDGLEITKQDYSQKQYGFSLGGPILKNKLFFFVNAEFNDETRPGQTKVAATPALPFSPANTNVALPTADFLNGVSSYLRSTYGYDPGVYQGYSNKSNNDKFLVRLDWNINKNHRFNVRYNQVESKSPSFVSTSVSGLNLNYSTNRTSNNALHFSNANYFQEQNLYSVSAELNSSFGRFTNSLRGTWTHQNDPRSSESSPFPFVDILQNGSPITSFGYELFTYGNLRDVETYTLNDDLTYTAGKHNITFGLQGELSKTKNGFQRFGTGFYSFDSWSDFVNGEKPSTYAITYSLNPDGSQAYPSFKFAQYSAYLQDEFQITDRVKLTGGLRLELPTYPDVSEMKTHPLVAGLTFANGEKIDTGNMPDSRLMFSPRFGFNWDVNGDRSMQLRGGTGIFTGRIPFVWIVAQSGDAGLLQYTQVFNGKANTPGPFSPDIRKYVPTDLPAAGTSIPSSISAMSKDLKFPQSWKSSLAFDTKLPFGIVGTIEGIYQKDINAVYARNANLNDPKPLNISGYPDNRDMFGGSNNAKQVNNLDSKGVPSATGTSSFNAIVMDNTKGGHYWSVSAQLNKQFRQGLSISAAYTHSDARNFGDLGGDQILNLWSYPYTVGNSNNPRLSYTSNVIPDRIIASVSFHKEYFQNLGTTLSVFYEGAIQGRYSYYYSTDFNRDGQINDLIYIPKDASEISFADIAAGNSAYGGKAFTAQQQSDIFFEYIENDKYLSKHKGQYAERNGAKLPWRNQVDLKFIQDVYKTYGKSKSTVQFTVDIFNFGNMLNSSWGNVKFVNNMGILVPPSSGAVNALNNDPNVTSTTRPLFKLNSANGDIVRTPFGTTQTTSSTYYMQFGLRYIFN
ncbi:TonB-dependent receptor [Arcticibacter tournemirensis]